MTKLTIGVAGALLLAACDSSGPSPADPRFNALVDGVAWEADTVVAVAIGSPSDTALSLSAVLRVSPTESQELTLFLKNWRPGPSTLGDTAAAGTGAFSVTLLEGDSAVGFMIYRTSATLIGHASITGLNRRDSLMTGTWQFEVAAMPDTLPHHQLTGTFRVHYSFQPVVVPGTTIDAT